MEKNEKGIVPYMKYSLIGIEMAGSVIVGGFIGYWLDGKLGTEPWMLIFWVICGIIAGFRSLYKMAKTIIDEGKNDDHQRPD